MNKYNYIMHFKIQIHDININYLYHIYSNMFIYIVIYSFLECFVNIFRDKINPFKFS